MIPIASEDWVILHKFFNVKSYNLVVVVVVIISAKVMIMATIRVPCWVYIISIKSPV